LGQYDPVFLGRNRE